MKKCLVTEIKSFLNFKAVWIVSFLFFALFFYITMSNAQNVVNSLDVCARMIEEINEYKPAGAILDPTVETSHANMVTLIYSAHNPNTFMNNISAMMLGLGVIFIPIVIIFYVGADYGKMATIKMKITYYSLKKVIMAKTIVAGSATIVLSAISYIMGTIIMRMKWNADICSAFQRIAGLFETTFQKELILESVVCNDFKVVTMTLLILLFYMFFVTFVVILSKNLITGLVVFFFFIYIKLPIDFMPTNIISNIIYYNLYQNEHSNFRFLPSGGTLTYEIQIGLLIAYFFALVVGLIYTVRKQKN